MFSSRKMKMFSSRKMKIFVLLIDIDYRLPMESDEYFSDPIWNKPYPPYLVDYIKYSYPDVEIGTRVWFWCGFNPYTKTRFSICLEKTETDWVIGVYDDQSFDYSQTPVYKLMYIDEYIERAQEIDDELDWYEREDNIRIFYARTEESSIDLSDNDEVAIDIEPSSEVAINIPEKNEI